MKPTLRSAAFALVLAPFLSAHAGTAVQMAPEPEPVASAGGWTFSAIPYGWLTAMTGDMRIRNISAPVDVSFKDTLENVDMAFMGTFAASCERWTLGMDFVYARFSGDSPGDGVTFHSIGVIQKQYLFTPAISYRVVQEANWNLEVLAGARITKLDGTINGNLIGGGTASTSKSKTWADPIIGVKGTAMINDRLNFIYGGTIGGFGVSSDFVWSALAGFGYHFTDNITGILGYRGLGVDYDKGGLAVDTTTHGPIIGVNFSF